MITKELELLVKDEAEKLKIHATPEEIGRLNFKNLRHEMTERCIYGQMTGDCYSKRATQLLKKCTTPYSSFLSPYRKPDKKTFTNDRWVFSPIEFYIANSESKREALIDFLQGKSETLNL